MPPMVPAALPTRDAKAEFGLRPGHTRPADTNAVRILRDPTGSGEIALDGRHHSGVVGDQDRDDDDLAIPESLDRIRHHGREILQHRRARRRQNPIAPTFERMVTRGRKLPTMRTLAIPPSARRPRNASKDEVTDGADANTPTRTDPRNTSAPGGWSARL